MVRECWDVRSTDEKVVINKNSDDRFNSFSNLNFSRTFSDLLKKDQNSSSNISTSPPERAAVTLQNLLNLKLRREF